jgi:hypothetical protein
MEAVVRRPGSRLNPWPTVGGSSAAVVAWGAAAVGAPEGGVLTLAGLALLGAAAGAWRWQTGRGRRLTGEDLAFGLLRDADIVRIARRHGDRHPELRAAVDRSGELLWTLSSPDLTPAERRQARAAHEAETALALQADEHLVALGGAPEVTTPRGDLATLVSALAAARVELDGSDGHGA